MKISKPDDDSAGGSFWRPWLFGAIIWLLLSLIGLIEFLHRGDYRHPTDIVTVFALLWAQFGFAGLFSVVYRRRFHLVSGFLVVMLLPPALLYLVSWILAWLLSSQQPYRFIP